MHIALVCVQYWSRMKMYPLAAKLASDYANCLATAAY